MPVARPSLQRGSSMSSETDRRDLAGLERGSPGEVFGAFLKLGVTSFGGPVAHLGYFRDELVIRRRWIDEAGYADLVALCQFLPGPASSQVGFSLGILRAGGLLGGLAAWSAFTLPSALILVAIALGGAILTGPVAEALLHGLKLVAVAVVAQAVWGMAKSLTPDRRRIAIALSAAAIVTFASGSWGQIGAIVIGALAGVRLCRGGEAQPHPGRLPVPVTRRSGIVALILFGVAFLVVPVLATLTGWQALKLFDAFYRSGALVFGGGHVVLPLLQSEVVPPGWVTTESFLAGYGLTQAVPGPLFTFAAYLGAVMGPSRTASAGRRSRSSPSSCRACSWSTARCRSGTGCASALWLRPPCGAPTRPWSASWASRSTAPSGQAPSCPRPMSRSRSPVCSCSSSGRRRPGWRCSP